MLRKRNNPKLQVTKAVLGESKTDDCCYRCNEFIPAGTRCVIINLFAPDASFYGRGAKIHMHRECWDRGGKYPPVKGLQNPLEALVPFIPLAVAGLAVLPAVLHATERIMPWNWGRREQRNPLPIDTRLITKGKSQLPSNSSCAYCGVEIEPGEKCIASTLIQGYEKIRVFIHLSCWERAGRYPPLYMPKGEHRRPLKKGDQGELLNPMSDNLWKDLAKIGAGASFKKYAIQYQTTFMFKDIPNTEIPMKMPDGTIRKIMSSESSQIYTVEPYWRTWREYEHETDVLLEVNSFLKSHLHNFKAGHSWEPVRIIQQLEKGGFKVFMEWLTVEEAWKDIYGK